MSGTIYFLQAAGGGPVKIGYTGGPARIRRNAAQVFAPDDLVVRAECPGSRATESLIHGVFTREHIRGEFFAPSPALEQFIEAIVDGLDVRELLAP